MDAQEHRNSSLTWSFQVKKIKNLPKEVPTQVEISGSHFLDGLCNKQVVFKIFDATPELKGRHVVAKAEVDATALIHESTELEKEILFSMESDYFALLGLSDEEVKETVSAEISITASAPLGPPEDRGDWNMFSVKVEEVCNLPSSLAHFGLNASQDLDCHPFTYSIHVLGAKIGGGSLMFPSVAVSEKTEKTEQSSLLGKNEKAGRTSKGVEVPEKKGGKKLPETRTKSSNEATSEGPEALSEGGPCVQSPAVSWGRNSETRFYRGRQFLSELLSTVDSVGGLWTYFLPRLKRERSEEKGKGNSKHGRVAPRGKTATKGDTSQALYDACKHFAGRAWIPLDALRRGEKEVEGSFEVVSFEFSRDGRLPHLASALSSERSANKLESGTPEPPATFADSGTRVKLRIQLRFPLQALEPRCPPLFLPPSLASEKGESLSFASVSSAALSCAHARESEREKTSLRSSPFLWDSLPSKSSLREFEASVKQGVKWIARELSEHVSLEEQRILATAATRKTSKTREKTGVRLNRETPHAGESPDSTERGPGKAPSGNGDHTEEEGESEEERVRREFLQRLKENGCYDELFQKVKKSVTLVIRDKLRKDVSLATAVTTATRGRTPQTLTEDMLVQKLDKLLSETFVFLVDTMQQIINYTTTESHNLRELAALHPANVLCPGERESEGQEELLQRLAFESEVVDDVERSVQLHKQLIVLAEKRKDKKAAVLWCSLARVLLRHGEHRVEEAEQALWESIRAQGSAEKASADTLLMLGSCCLHRQRYKDAEMAFASAVRRCGETETNAKAAALSGSPPAERLSPSLSLSLGGVGWHSGFARDHESGESQQEKSACSENASPRSSPASTMAPQVLPFFFLSVCHYLAGDTASFEKYLALAFKPAAFFESEKDLNDPPDESEEEKPGNEKSGEDTQTSSTNPAWPEGIFDELEEMLPIFPKETFFEPATVDFPILGFLLLLLKFGLPSLCLSFFDRADDFVHSATSQSGLFTFVKAKALFLRKDFVGAARALREVLQSGPRHRQALALLAESYYRLHLVHPAVEIFLKSIDFLDQPRDSVIYLRLGELMLQQKNYEEAHKFYRKSLEYAITSEGWLGVAVSLYRLGNLPGALEAAMVSNGQDKDRGETWGYLALCLLSTDRVGEADMCTRFLIKNLKKNPRGGLGVLGGATTEKIVRKIDPDLLLADCVETKYIDWGGGLLVEVADTYLRKKGHYGAQTAQALAERALHECPENAAAHKVLSQALAWQGQSEAALGELLSVMRYVVENFKDAYRQKRKCLYDLFYDVEEQQEAVHEEAKGFTEQKLAVQAKLSEAYDQCQNLFPLLSSSEPIQEVARMHKKHLEELSRLTASSLEPGALTERELESDL
ncbi:UNVERIFIED_CONTAM: tetratricopeptide repeat-containing protein [Hammondia hammondi]|eukprot:XP_008884793.1 tetratricopeptide repeat-containing protein [Hammondia hammondi]